MYFTGRCRILRRGQDGGRERAGKGDLLPSLWHFPWGVWGAPRWPLCGGLSGGSIIPARDCGLRTPGVSISDLGDSVQLQPGMQQAQTQAPNITMFFCSLPPGHLEGPHFLVSLWQLGPHDQLWPARSLQKGCGALGSCQVEILRSSPSLCVVSGTVLDGTALLGEVLGAADMWCE